MLIKSHIQCSTVQYTIHIDTYIIITTHVHVHADSTGTCTCVVLRYIYMYMCGNNNIP